MSTSTQNTELTFNTLPTSFRALTEETFKDSQPSASILPLPDIEDAEAIHVERWLHPDESQKLATFTFEKRHREWLGGRICAKQSLGVFSRRTLSTAIVIPEHTQYTIQSEDSGRPYFASINRLDFIFPELSISHSNDFAAAMSSASPCGIDIQFSAKNLDRVRERFCSEPEGELLEQELDKSSNLSRLTLLWSAKEAVKKMLSPGGIPGFQELHLRRIEQRNDTDMIFTFSRNSETTSIKTAVSMIHDDYAVAICCAGKRPVNDK